MVANSPVPGAEPAADGGGACGPFDPAIILGTPLFGGLPEDCRCLLTDRLEARGYPRGASIYRQGEPGREMFILARGAVTHCKDGCPLRDLRPGDFFGEVSFLDMQPRSGTAIVDEDAEVYVLPYGALRQLYQVNLRAYALIVMNLAREVSRRLRSAEHTCAGHHAGAR